MAAGRQIPLLEIPTLQLPPVEPVKIGPLPNDGDILRLFAVQHPAGHFSGQAALFREAYEMTADNPLAQQVFPEAIDGGVSRPGHPARNFPGHENMTCAIAKHGEVNDERLGGKICELVENFRQRPTGQ